jgi:hypothetical protein
MDEVLDLKLQVPPTRRSARAAPRHVPSRARLRRVGRPLLERCHDGTGSESGMNEFGKSLMRVRERLRAEGA